MTIMLHSMDQRNKYKIHKYEELNTDMQFPMERIGHWDS